MQHARRAASAASISALISALTFLSAPASAVAQMQAPAAAAQSSTQAQDAATRRQSDQTARADRAAAIPDETVKPPPVSGNDSTNKPHTSGTAPSLSYGPVLVPRGQAGQSAARKDPSEVRDETDTLTRGSQSQSQPQSQPRPRPQPPATTAPLSPQQSPQQAPQPTGQQQRAAARRHPSLQPEGALAPRPLHASGEPSAAGNPEPIPAPTPGLQPIVPSSSVINSCQGSLCRTTSGAAVNLGAGNAGVNSSGRLCARTGATVQCF